MIMKTKVLPILAAMIFIFTATYAKDPQAVLRRSITAEVEFPKVAVDLQKQGTVFAEFTVKEDGSIEVLNCFSFEGELQSYVFQKLASLKVNADPGIVGKKFLMRFDFELV
jgi:hypothetical protein